MQNPSKLSVATGPGLQGWADLPDGPLDSILALSGSFRDLLAFAATCRSWRAAFSSYPSKSTFCAKFPPLLIQFKHRVQAPDLPSNNGRHELRTCKVFDPTNKNVALRCQIPQAMYEKMHFAGTSYGQLICCRGRHCLVLDVFSGAEVSPPPLPFSADFKRESYASGNLTAPITSPNSHLIVSTKYSLFDWPVGSDSWSELKLSGARINQIVEFNGQFIAMDDSYKIYTLQLAPHLGLQDITTEWCDDRIDPAYIRPWLAVCGDMLLLIVDHRVSFSFGAPVVFRSFLVDMSTKPAKWVEVKKLDNWALFVSGDVRSPLFSCLNPEQWEGAATACSTPIALSLGAYMAWVTMRMLCGVLPRTPVLCAVDTCTSSCRPCGCTQACSTPMVSDFR